MNNNVTNKVHTFQINVLIQFFVSSTCFEHDVFIIRKTILCMQFMVCFHAEIIMKGYVR